MTDFEDEILNCEDCIAVRKSKKSDVCRFHREEYVKEEAIKEYKQKVKDSIDKSYLYTSPGGTELCDREQLKKELGLE